MLHGYNKSKLYRKIIFKLALEYFYVRQNMGLVPNIQTICQCTFLNKDKLLTILLHFKVIELHLQRSYDYHKLHVIYLENSKHFCQLFIRQFLLSAIYTKWKLHLTKQRKHHKGSKHNINKKSHSHMYTISWNSTWKLAYQDKFASKRKCREASLQNKAWSISDWPLWTQVWNNCFFHRQSHLGVETETRGSQMTASDFSL